MFRTGWQSMLKAGCGQLGAMMGGYTQFTGEMLAYVEIPSRCVSSCSFGGPEYDWLFVTSFALGTDAENKIRRYHCPGAIFVVQDLNTSGQPANKFIKHSL